MPRNHNWQQPEPEQEDWSDYLTPEQRADAVAEILTTIALRILKQRHEQDHQNSQD